MSLRFRKRIKIFKGLYVNLSKSGGSVSVGGRGVTTNFSKKGLSMLPTKRLLLLWSLITATVIAWKCGDILTSIATLIATLQ